MRRGPGRRKPPTVLKWSSGNAHGFHDPGPAAGAVTRGAARIFYHERRGGNCPVRETWRQKYETLKTPHQDYRPIEHLSGRVLPGT